MTKSFSAGVSIDGQDPDAQTTRFINVRRRVRQGKSLDWLGCSYTAGSVVTLNSDAAFRLEGDGVLERVPGKIDVS